MSREIPVAVAVMIIVVSFRFVMSDTCNITRSYRITYRDFFSTFMGARVMFSRIVLLANRLKCWKTMPIFCR